MSYNLRKRQSNTSIPEPSTVKRCRTDAMVEHVKEEEDKSPVPHQTDSEDEEDDDSDEEEIFDIEEQLKKLKDIDPEAHTALAEIKLEIARTEPDVKMLLLTPMRLEDRAKLCQYYEIYKMQVPNTNEWLECRNRYNDMYKEYKVGYEQSRKYSHDDMERMKLEEEKFTGFDAQLALKYKILNLETSKENKEVIYRRYEEFLSLDTTDDEFGKLKHWLTWATDVPHDRVKEIQVDNVTEFIQKAKNRLDSELYGMNKVKEQILLFLSAKLRNPHMVNSNLGLVGAPGCGKTHIARLLSEIMDWGFAQISFGGMDKADFLKGHEYTYVGAQPGEIVKCLKRMGHKNGVIFLDELDKIAENPEIRSALLHMIDPTQNKAYTDNFLGGEIAIDLSKIWYVGSMNTVPRDEALADRWWMVNVKGYGFQDKVKIIQNYLIPRALKNCSMIENSVALHSGAAGHLISIVCGHNDKGVRTLEKSIKDLINKINFLVTHQDADGKLPFKTSFELGKRLEFPVLITNVLLDKLLESKELDSMLSMMYI
jgi:ATP-dependent Lon protease